MDGRLRDRELAVLGPDPVVGPHHAFLEGGRGQDHLEGRAGLEGIGDRAVAPDLAGGHVEERVRIERRPQRQCEHVAGARVQGDRHRAPGLRAAVGGVDLPLRQVLDRPVERQHHAVPRRRRRQGLRHRDLAAQRIAADDGPARRARERVVEGALDALQSAVHPLEAEHVGGQLAVRVQAQRLVQEAEPGLAEAAHARRHGRRQLAPQPDEALARGELGVQLALRRVEDRRQPCGDAHRIAHRARLGEERLGGRRGRQRRAVTVEDRTARAVQGDRARILALGEGGQLRALDDHQPAQPARQAHERDGEERREYQDPRPEGGGVHGVGRLSSSAASTRFFWAAASPVVPVTYSRARRN